jgi:8-oxo-dGTP diphosphatase
MVTVDIVLFRVRNDCLETLLVKRGKEPYKGRWVFPGGFINMDERLGDAAARELQEETGMTNIVLESFGSFDNPKRDPRGRVISIAHLGLLPRENETEVQGADDAAEAQWFRISDVPSLAFDHDEMLETAFEWLASRLGIITEEPHCFLTMSPEEQTAIRGCVAEMTKEQENRL